MIIWLWCLQTIIHHPLIFYLWDNVKWKNQIMHCFWLEELCTLQHINFPMKRQCSVFCSAYHVYPICLDLTPEEKVDSSAVSHSLATVILKTVLEKLWPVKVNGRFAIYFSEAKILSLLFAVLLLWLTPVLSK